MCGTRDRDRGQAPMRGEMRECSIPAPIAKLLIVDDEVALMRALCDTLDSQGYETTGFTSAVQALDALREQSFDILLTDLMMPLMDGISVLKAAFEIDPNLAGIV